ncbi:MAG: ABC-F family ATP-binding cassette domain-containing protein [Deltaproteobacteria bacterium]|nr:ABC-F family ATP-binding cassette domain-containing protein [Deltaproteobacteria bacterium]
MQLVQVAGLSFGYDQGPLFADVTFSLNRGERAALVAPNGAGKTTLLRLLAGELEPDQGSVTVPSPTRVAFYRQSHELGAQGTVRESLLAGYRDLLALRAELGQAERDAASGTRTALDRLAAVTDRYHVAGGDEVERRVETVAGRLGFAGAGLDRTVASLSGGERGRLRLGAALARPADLLLLDEPTNHLDLDSIRWLEQHLCSLTAALVCVSHDRAFLDAVCPTTMELGHKRWRVYRMAYGAYERAREGELERERQRAQEQRAFVAKTEDFIRRNIAAQKTKQAQARRRMLEKLDRLEMPEDVWTAARKLRFRFAAAPRSGDVALEAKGLRAERGGRVLFSDLDLLVRRGDRIGVIGPNGSGKTTLLRLLCGQGAPGDGGQVRRGANVCAGYYDQHLGSLDEDRSGIDEIRSRRPDMNEDFTREYLARFGFYRDDPFRRVANLSGGERSRLALAKLLLDPLNLLLLDEPTNHLDIPAVEILEQALVHAPGSAIVVSHDRRFLEAVTGRIVVLEGGACEIYEGGYRDWAEHVERRRTRPGAGDGHAPCGSPGGPAPPGAFYAERKRATRELERKRRRVAELEQQIAAAETAVAAVRAELGERAGEQWHELALLAERERSLQQELDAKLREWAALGEELSP